MPTIIKAIIAFALSAIGVGVSQIPEPVEPVIESEFSERYEALGGFGQAMAVIYRHVPPVTTTTLVEPVYKHGDCSWLPALALKAGWAQEHLKQLQHVALREAGCCVNRLGGDSVDKDCKITGVSDKTHRSDTGLLQINGVNFDLSRNPSAPICLQMGVCTQEPLLDALQTCAPLDYFTKLQAGNRGQYVTETKHANR